MPYRVLQKRSQVSTFEVEIDGYEIKRSDRDRHGGGVAKLAS